MKQMLRDMKINSIISLLHMILGLGGLGGSILILNRHMLMQYLGMAPGMEKSDSGDMIICLIAAAMVLFALYLLGRALSGNLQKKAKEFISKLDAGEKEKLVWDYQNAWRGSRTIRIGQQYTFVLDDGARIFRNSDIVWLYEWSESRSYYFNLYLLNQEEPEIFGTTEKTYPAIMEYYEKHFPHIVVGDSDEARYLYRQDRNQFLHLRYYDEQNKAE